MNGQRITALVNKRELIRACENRKFHFHTPCLFYADLFYVSVQKRRQNLIYHLLLHLPNRNHLRRYVLIWQQRFLIPGNIVPFSALITGIFSTRPSSGIRIRYASHRSSHSDLSPDCRLYGRPVPLKALKRTRSIRLPMPFDVTRLSRYSETFRIPTVRRALKLLMPICIANDSARFILADNPRIFCRDRPDAPLKFLQGRQLRLKRDRRVHILCINFQYRRCIGDSGQTQAAGCMVHKLVPPYHFRSFFLYRQLYMILPVSSTIRN